MLHQMAAGIVGDDGVLDAVFTQLPGCQPGSLIKRSGFIDPDVDINAVIKGGIDGCGSRAVFNAGQPSGIAVREHIDGLATFAAA